MANTILPHIKWWHFMAACVLVLFTGLVTITASAQRPSGEYSAKPQAPAIDTSTPVRARSNAPLVTATATPTQPVLVDEAVAPVVASPAGTLVLSYTVFSPNTQDVSLGAGLRVSACTDFFTDAPHDRTLTIPAGTSVVTRTFSLPNTSNVTYDVEWGLWSAGFGTQYGLQTRTGAVSVAGPTATPAVPTLLDMDLEPDTAYRGSSIVLTYTVYCPTAQQIGLGADMAPEGTGSFTSDPPNDRVVSAVAGSNVLTRSFNLGTRLPGYYTVRWGLWNSTFTGQYDLRQRPGVLNIWEVGTGTPPVSPTPRATPTRTATNSPCNTPVPPTSTFTFTATPATTFTPTTSATPTGTQTNTATFTPTGTQTNTPSNTPTDSPVNTDTSTPTDTPADTATATPTGTATDTPTNTSANTATGTATKTNTPTSTPAQSETPTDTATETYTPVSTDTPTRTDTPVYSPTSAETATHTPTDSPTETPADLPTNAPTLTSTGTPTPDQSALLVGHVIWQGRPAQPNALQQVAITLTLKSDAIEVNYPAQTTDPSGFFTVTLSGLSPGTYAWRVKNSRYLANSGSVAWSGSGVTNVEMGLMKAGDCNNDNVVSVQDFNILKNTFGKSQGDPGYDDRADFTGDHAVSIGDFNVQRGNFGQVGAPPL